MSTQCSMTSRRALRSISLTSPRRRPARLRSSGASATSITGSFAMRASDHFGFDVDRVPTRSVQIYTLSTVHPELGGVDFDLAVEDDVFPLDWADVPDEFGIGREFGRGGGPGDLPGLPVDDAGDDQRQARTRVHLVKEAGIADQMRAGDIGDGHGSVRGKRALKPITSVVRNMMRFMFRICLSIIIRKAALHRQSMKTVAYLRFSTAQQDAGSQRLAILEYARKHGFQIVDFIEATARGQATEKRRRLDELIGILQRGVQ